MKFKFKVTSVQHASSEPYTSMVNHSPTEADPAIKTTISLRQVDQSAQDDITLSLMSNITIIYPEMNEDVNINDIFVLDITREQI